MYKGLGAKDEMGDLRRNPDLNQEGFQKARSIVLGKVLAPVPRGPGQGCSTSVLRGSRHRAQELEAPSFQVLSLEREPS